MFADRVALCIADGGALSNATATARWDTLNAYIESASVGESARWGDSLVELGGEFAVTRTRDEDWQNEVTTIRSLLQVNKQHFLDELVNAGLYSTLDAPVFSPSDGQVVPGSPVSISKPNGSGSIVYTLDGSDPRGNPTTISSGPITITDSV